MPLILLAVPSKEEKEGDLYLAKEVLSALKPDVLVSDGALPWSRSLALAANEYDTRLIGAQPWRMNVSKDIKFNTFNVFYESALEFTHDPSRYFDWLKDYVDAISVIKNGNSSLSHTYLVKLNGKKVYEHER